MTNADDPPRFGFFIENMMRSESLLTSFGYGLPRNFILLQSASAHMLELADAPFIFL